MRNVIIFSITVLLNIAIHDTALADVFKWQDESGVTHYSQFRPQQVIKKPQVYRGSVHVVELQLMAKKIPLVSLHKPVFDAEQYSPAPNPARTESTWAQRAKSEK